MVAKVILLILFSLITFCVKSQYASIYTFSVSINGNDPYGNLLYEQGYLYGATEDGGLYNKGILYRVKTEGTGYETLMDLNDSTGYWSLGPLIADSSYLYGTTSYGGGSGEGIIFKIKRDGTGFLKIFDFNFSINCGRPLGSLAFDGTFLYGTTGYGGIYGYGTFYKIKPDGTNFTMLYHFDDINGKYPCGTVVINNNYLYTITTYGGTNSNGVICKIKTDGTGFTKLLDFNNINGQWPRGSLILDSGFLYGMTTYGGTINSNNGTIFKIKTDGTGYANLLNFDGMNGGLPVSSLYSDGTYLYGITPHGSYGSVFKIKNDGTNFSKLYSFTATSDGAFPEGFLVSDGNCLYSAVKSGWYGGTIFRIGDFLGIKENNLQYEFKISPNPANSILSITSDVEYNSIKIINSIGQAVANFENKPNTISVSELSNGIYFIQLFDKKGIILKTEKFIKN